MTDGDPIGGTGEAGGSPGTLIFRPVEDGALIGVDDAAVDHRGPRTGLRRPPGAPDPAR